MVSNAQKPKICCLLTVPIETSLEVLSHNAGNVVVSGGPKSLFSRLFAYFLQVPRFVSFRLFFSSSSHISSKVATDERVVPQVVRDLVRYHVQKQVNIIETIAR